MFLGEILKINGMSVVKCIVTNWQRFALLIRIKDSILRSQWAQLADNGIICAFLVCLIVLMWVGMGQSGEVIKF